MTTPLVNISKWDYEFSRFKTALVPESWSLLEGEWTIHKFPTILAKIGRGLLRASNCGVSRTGNLDSPVACCFPPPVFLHR